MATEQQQPPYVFEFDARILHAQSSSFERKTDKNGQPLSTPKVYYINRYSFVSERCSGVLIEWLDSPTPPSITSGVCKIRFRALKASREFGFFEVTGYPVSVK